MLLILPLTLWNYITAWTPPLRSLCLLFWFSHPSIPSSPPSTFHPPPLQLHPPSCLTLCLIKEPVIRSQTARRELHPAAAKVGRGVERMERQRRGDAEARSLVSFQLRKEKEMLRRSAAR